MKYKKGDDIYLKGQIVGVSSCSEFSYPYEVLIADEFIDVKEKDIVSVNEPEKAVLNEEEAEWLEHLKLIGNFTRCLYVITRQGWGYDFEFRSHGKKYKLSCANKNDGDENEQTKNRLVNALIYGYEVKKEKLYTVKISNEDFGKIYIGIFKAVNKFGISSLPLNDDDIKTWFTEDELKRFKFWDNPAFEIKEVE